LTEDEGSVAIDATDSKNEEDAEVKAKEAAKRKAEEDAAGFQISLSFVCGLVSLLVYSCYLSDEDEVNLHLHYSYVDNIF
jgi:hypothetical protein